MSLTPQQKEALTKLINALQAMPSSDGLFSPYGSAKGSYAEDSRDEVGEEADHIRTHNLRTYLTHLLQAGADVILCGEAPSYAGCRFSGCAFSDEVRLAAQEFPFSGCQLLPRARNNQRELMKERSASVVWQALKRSSTMPVLWNSVQLHPHIPGKALTNRTPTREEVELGRPSLEALIELVQPRMIVAVGRTAQKALERMGYQAEYVRHPAHGGHREFVKGLERLGVIRKEKTYTQGVLF